MTSFVGGLLVKGRGLLTHGLSGHLEPGFDSALGTRGLLWTWEGLQPAWATSQGLALPGALAALLTHRSAPAQPFVSKMIHPGVAFTGILGTNSGECKTHPHLNMHASASFPISLSLFQAEFWEGDFCPALPQSPTCDSILRTKSPSPSTYVSLGAD